MRCERGQASVEWVGLVLLASLALGALAAAVPAIDGRSFGGFLSHHILCATRARDCGDRDAALTAAYGADDAALVRRHAPGIVYEPGERSLPVDWRACRARTCSEAADDRDLDTHRTGTGLPATAFTRLVRREGRVYLQYWLYYPDSNTAALGSDKVWNASPLRALGRYPGFHPRRLGGVRGADRPRRGGECARQLARPLAVVQARRMPLALGALDRVDARLARKPRRSRAAESAHKPAARPAGRVWRSGRGGSQRSVARRWAPRADHHGGGVAPRARSSRSRAAATARWTRTSGRRGSSLHTAIRRTASPEEAALYRRPAG